MVPTKSSPSTNSQKNLSHKIENVHVHLVRTICNEVYYCVNGCIFKLVAIFCHSFCGCGSKICDDFVILNILFFSKKVCQTSIRKLLGQKLCCWSVLSQGFNNPIHLTITVLLKWSIRCAQLNSIRAFTMHKLCIAYSTFILVFFSC